MSGARHWEQDKEATVYIGNLDERVSDALVWELMLQAGRIVNVHLPKDRVTQTHQGFGFVEFISEEDAEYAARIMNQVRLYGKPIRVNKASADKQKTVEVGAELFVGNLDSMVDEKTLYDTFSTFGNLVSAPKIARDDAGISKGFGFISYDSFEASDKAIESMDKQFLMNKEINVQYAYKKDGKGERHGDQAERLLAAQARKHNVSMPAAQLPPALFAPQGPAGVPPPTPVIPSGPGGYRAPPPQAPRQPNGMGMNMGMGGHEQHQQYHHEQAPPPRGPPQGFQQSQLAPPPQGLPPRPPPPSGFQPMPQGYPQQMPGMAPPPGFGRPPMPQGFQQMGAPGYPPQGMPGQGYPGAPPPPPAGFAPPRR
ncbi:RNA-binding domain-containing protein [Wilcoxina mikolae CBS 423.85]|nr:RNA-binding domain-containing protein [Wilcoxina mikolae CBS 423.85]